MVYPDFSDLPDYPRPYRDGHDDIWPASCSEDYAKVRSDDERRYLLLRWGYDCAHRCDVIRLFGISQEFARRQEDQKNAHKRRRLKKMKDLYDFLLLFARKVWKVITGLILLVTFLYLLMEHPEFPRRILSWLSALFSS